MPRKYNKDAIIAKGMMLIREKGFSKTGVTEILTACGIPKGSFYNFFKSKEDFGFQAVDLYSRYIEGMFLQFEDKTELTPVEKLRGFFKLSNENFRKEGCTLNCLLLSLSNEISESNSTFAQSIFESFERFKGFLAKWIAAGQADGSIVSDSKPEDLADFLYDSYHGAIMRMKYLQSCKSLDGFMNHHLNYVMC